MTDQACYTLLGDLEDSEPPTEADLKKMMEKGNVKDKIRALEKAIHLMFQGERFPGLLMWVIRFVMPQDDHTIKKLLLVFWEIVPKTNSEGKLLHEMILVCDAYRKDLQHPNEYVRGSTLRFLCKLKEPELLEPLMPSIQECLAHRHSYVRRNAVLAVYTIYKNFDYLLPDAPELIHNFLEQEQDASCKRNAFMMLITADQSRALNYLSSCIDQVQTFNEILQLVIVELVHKVCRSDVSMRSRFIRCIYNLLDSSSAAVRYDAAGTLLTLSSAPTAVTAAATCYTKLISKESDNNVKLIVLDRLFDLKRSPQHERVLQNIIMDILRILAAPDIQVRKKTLDLVMDLITTRNASEVVMFLKKELAKTESEEEFDKNAEYRQLLVRVLHSCGVKFPNLAPEIVPQLMDFLADPEGQASAMDVILFVREAFEELPDLRPDMMNKLLEVFGTIKNSKVSRATLWIIGEYTSNAAEVEKVLAVMKKAIGAIPIVDSEIREAAALEAEEEGDDDQPKVVTRTRITADGTYATESAYTTVAKKTVEEKPALRQMLLDGDFFVATPLATALTKLANRYSSFDTPDEQQKLRFTGEVLLILASIIHLGKSGLPKKPIDDDSYDRIMICIRVLTEPSDLTKEIFESHCRTSFTRMLTTVKAQQDSFKSDSTKKKVIDVQCDDVINFRALRVKEDVAEEDEFELNLTRATGAGEDSDKQGSKLSKVFQLSGFSDPVYAEAYVNVHQYDIMLDVLVLNQTGDTLQNLTLELATLGDLKLTEKPSSHTLGAHDFCNITANVKVSSTETGIIFGNIVYEVSGAGSERNCVVLNDIHIDIMDYIRPGYCSDVDFRTMWAGFEWENKVAVRTSIPTLRGYLDHLVQTTNMKCLTPESALEGECDFLAANLYAKSVFGEDALANLSIEKGADGLVTGHIRIRSKTQGIALSLGDKITLSQKEGLSAN